MSSKTVHPTVTSFAPRSTPSLKSRLAKWLAEALARGQGPSFLDSVGGL